MHIIQIDTWLTRAERSADGWMDVKPFLLVCVRADTGHIGWGEALILPAREQGVHAMIHALGQQFMAENTVDPTAFVHFAQNLTNKHRSIDFSSACSALEIALWDMKGQVTGQPVYELLGKQQRTTIPLYANAWSNDVPDIASLTERCRTLVAQGHHAVKIYPLHGRNPEQAKQCMASVRLAVGPDIDIMTDLYSPDDPEVALTTARSIKPYNPYWIEEPCDGDDVPMLAALKQQIGVPIVTGERQSGLPHFNDVIRLKAADILNPDVVAMGGFIELLELAKHCDSVDMTLSLHCWGTMTIAASAMAHICAVVPNIDKAEYFPSFVEFSERFAQTDFSVKNGHFTLGHAAGLGVQVDVDQLQSLAEHRVSKNSASGKA